MGHLQPVWWREGLESALLALVVDMVVSWDQGGTTGMIHSLVIGVDHEMEMGTEGRWGLEGAVATDHEREVSLAVWAHQQWMRVFGSCATGQVVYLPRQG